MHDYNTFCKIEVVLVESCVELKSSALPTKKCVERSFSTHLSSRDVCGQGWWLFSKSDPLKLLQDNPMPVGSARVISTPQKSPGVAVFWKPLSYHQQPTGITFGGLLVYVGLDARMFGSLGGRMELLRPSGALAVGESRNINYG